MNKEIKAKWVAALRSGDYIQGRGHLRQNSFVAGEIDHQEYCCLGVLTDIYHKETNGVFTDKEAAAWCLQENVCLWAVDENNPVLGEHSCVTANDVLGLNFNEIADLIEKHL